jgi:hypothetical protein
MLESAEHSSGRSRYIWISSALFSIEMDHTNNSLVENQRYFKSFIGDSKTEEVVWDIEF